MVLTSVTSRGYTKRHFDVNQEFLFYLFVFFYYLCSVGLYNGYMPTTAMCLQYMDSWKLVSK